MNFTSKIAMTFFILLASCSDNPKPQQPRTIDPFVSVEENRKIMFFEYHEIIQGNYTYGMYFYILGSTDLLDNDILHVKKQDGEMIDFNLNKNKIQICINHDQQFFIARFEFDKIQKIIANQYASFHDFEDTCEYIETLNSKLDTEIVSKHSIKQLINECR